tara:strand:- start:1017 stop:1484 length:468 start_codon:yes stop_codon:yes gene_type:complete
MKSYYILSKKKKTSLKEMKSTIIQDQQWILLSGNGGNSLNNYFDLIWNYCDQNQRILDSKWINSPKFNSYKKELQEFQDTIIDERDSIDAFSDDKEAFLYLNFWILVSEFVSRGKAKDFAKLCLKSIDLDPKEKEDKQFIQVLRNLNATYTEEVR